MKKSSPAPPIPGLNRSKPFQIQSWFRFSIAGRSPRYSEKRRLTFWAVSFGRARSSSKMLISQSRRQAPSRGALQKTRLNQERFIDVLIGVLFLADGGRHRLNTDWYSGT